MGWDPFDGLNSRLFNAVPLKHLALARLAWLQLFKRMPTNIRPLALISKTTNAVTAGLAARTYSLLGDEENTARQLNSLLLQRSPSMEWGHGAWGYPFVWQARAFHVPATTPNIISTAFSCRAIFESGGDLNLIEEAAKFVMRHLVRRPATNSVYIGYIPGDETMVHNANLWGAYLLALAGKLSGSSIYTNTAQEALAFSANAQSSNGSWTYGQNSHHQFVDSFHTGYNLEALYLASRLCNSTEYDTALEKGLDFYAQNLFLHDGTPKYYAHQTHPIDCNSVSQAVITFSTVLPTQTRRDLSNKVLKWALDNLWLDNKSYFCYQKSGWGLNKISYMRWTQIWMLYTLAHWLSNNPEPLA